MIDSFGISQRWTSSTNYGTEELQHEIPSLSEIMFSIFSNKISDHFGPHAPSSSCKNDLKIITYQIFIVWVFGIFSSSKECTTYDKYFKCLKCTALVSVKIKQATDKSWHLLVLCAGHCSKYIMGINSFNLPHSPIRRWYYFSHL